MSLEILLFTSKLFICLDQAASILLLQTMNQVFYCNINLLRRGTAQKRRGKVEKNPRPKTAVLNLAGALGTTGLSRSGRGVAAHQGPRVTGALPVIVFLGSTCKITFQRGLCVPVRCPLRMVDFVVTTLSLAFLCIMWQSGKSIDAKQTRIPGESAPKICMIELMDQILPVRPISCNNLHTHICGYDIQ